MLTKSNQLEERKESEECDAELVQYILDLQIRLNHEK